MAWNEPDNDDRKDDPWSNRPGGKDQGPPDLEELVNSYIRKLSGLFGGGRGGSSGGDGGGEAISGGLVVGVLVILAIIWIGAGFYTVDEQERGVVLRFGVAQDAVVLPGLHWNPPLVDEVTLINVTRVYDRDFSDTMLTEDDNIIDITMTVQYVITDARKYYLEVEDPEISLQHAAESAIRHVVGSSTMDNAITTGRDQIAQDTMIRLQNYMDLYGTGITVRQVNIEQSLTALPSGSHADTNKDQRTHHGRPNPANKVIVSSTKQPSHREFLQKPLLFGKVEDDTRAEDGREDIEAEPKNQGNRKPFELICADRKEHNASDQCGEV